MSVSRSPAPSSIDLSGVPARVAEAVAQVVAVCHEQFRPDPCPEAFEEAELRVRETMNGCARRPLPDRWQPSPLFRRSASALPVSRPAQRSLALRPA